MDNKIQVGLRLEKNILELIDKFAAREMRTRTNMIEVILSEYACNMQGSPHPAKSNQ